MNSEDSPPNGPADSAHSSLIGGAEADAMSAAIDVRNGH